MTSVGALARITLLGALICGGCVRDRSDVITRPIDEPELEANQPIRHTTSRFIQTRARPAVVARSNEPQFLDQIMAAQAQLRASTGTATPQAATANAAPPGPTLQELTAPDLGSLLATGLSSASSCAGHVEQVYSVQVTVDVSEYGRVLHSNVSGAPSSMEGCVARVADGVTFPEARGQVPRRAYAAIQLGRAALPTTPATPEPARPLPEGARGAATTLSARATSVHEAPPVGYVPPSRMLIPNAN